MFCLFFDWVFGYRVAYCIPVPLAIAGGRGADSAKGPPRPPLELGSGSANGQEEGVSFLTGSPPSFPTNTMWTCNRGKEEWISLGNQGGLPGGSSLWDGLQGVIGVRQNHLGISG